MHGDIERSLRENLCDRGYAEEYASSFLNAFIATQIKVIREQRRMTQAELGGYIGTTQAGISRYENVNYSSWSLRTLMKLAHAFDVRLKVSFEPYGTLPDEVIRFNRERLQVVERENDPGIYEVESATHLDTVTDIGAFKALAGIGQISETIGGQGYGGGVDIKGEGTSDDGTGRPLEWRQDTALGLRSAAG